MPNTTTWSITYPDSSTNLTPLESHFAEIANDTDAALTVLKANVRGTNTADTLETLKTSVTAINTRLALNLQTSVSTPVGAPTNSGVEGSMHWDSTNNILYIYDNTVGWRVVFRDTGWVNLTMTGGTPNYVAGTPTPQYRVVDNTVHLRGLIQKTGTIVAGTEYPFASLASYAPSVNSYFTVPSNSVSAPTTDHLKSGRLIVASNGNIAIISSYGGADAPSYYINCSYPLG